SDRLYGKNVLGIVLRIEWATVLNGGPMFAVVGETLSAGKRPVRLERVGRPEMKNITLSAKAAARTRLRAGARPSSRGRSAIGRYRFRRYLLAIVGGVLG